MKRPIQKSAGTSNRPQWLKTILESESAFKILAFTCFLVILGATFGVLKLCTDDDQILKDFGVLVAILSATIGAMLAHLILKKLGANSPVIGGDSRMKLYVYGGFGAAIVLALLLSISNYNGTRSQRRSEDYSRAEREKMGRIERGLKP